MKITKIVKSGNYYKVKFEDEVIKLHESVIIKYKLIKKGIEIDNEKLELILKENEYFLALDKGIKYLGTIHSKKEVYNYLIRSYEKDLVLRVIDKLTELNLIDDALYANYYISYAMKKRIGLNKVILDLKEENIPLDIIDEVITAYSFDLLKENCLELFNKYIKRLKPDSVKGACDKVKKYLVDKGFDYELVLCVVNDNLELIKEIANEDEAILKSYQKLIKSKTNVTDKKFKEKAIRSLLGKGYPLDKVLKLLK